MPGALGSAPRTKVSVALKVPGDESSCTPLPWSKGKLYARIVTLEVVGPLGSGVGPQRRGQRLGVVWEYKDRDIGNWPLARAAG